MSGAWGVTQAGFVVKPLANIIADMQSQIWSTINPTLDLSPATPDGQFIGVYAAASASLWELLQVIYNQFNRQDAEGQALDNIGDITGNPRETASYTQVFCTLTISAANAPYAAGALVANVQGSPNFTFSNPQPVTAAMISGGTATGVLMQSTVIGPTAAVNAGTLNQIPTLVTGWTAITNPTAQFQIGTNAELDQAYTVRQVQELAGQGSCNPGSTAEAIIALGAAQSPPIALQVSVLENKTPAPLTVNGLILPQHSFAPVVYDASGTGWLAQPANQQLVANTIYANKPVGIATAPVGTSYVVTDPILGQQTVYFTTPVGVPIFVSATISIATGYTFANVVSAIQAALVAAAVAPTPPNGIQPTGQLVPGGYVIGSQLSSVIQGVAGVLDVQALTFGTSASPSNTLPITFTAGQVPTILGATVATNVVITQGVPFP